MPTINDATKKLKKNVAAITRHKGPLVLPEDMTFKAAIEVLQARIVYDDQKVSIQEPIKAFVWDGALALQQALTELYGEALQAKTFDARGREVVPNVIKVPISPTETVSVPWGQFQIPGVTGTVSCDYMIDGGRAIFRVVAEITHKDEDKLYTLITRVREIALTQSIYKGKAFRLQFHDNTEGEHNPAAFPQFITLSNNPAIFPRPLESAIAVNILAPIRYAAACRDARIPLKRGILVAGPYGCGKTLLANDVAREATGNGWTFIYVTRIEELPDILRFAQGYMPCVVFAEDIDRFAGPNRTDEVNNLLNTLDGIGSKSDELMLIVTSNHPESINSAMRRPGRIDLVLKVEPPDAEASIRLVQQYGGQLLDSAADFTSVGPMLAGLIPATIREVVERSKLVALERTGGHYIELTVEDLTAAANLIRDEQKLFTPKALDATPMEQLGAGLGQAIAKGFARIRPNMPEVNATRAVANTLISESQLK